MPTTYFLGTSALVKRYHLETGTAFSMGFGHSALFSFPSC